MKPGLWSGLLFTALYVPMLLWTNADAQEAQISIGAGYQEGDRFRYGQYSGQPESGGFSVGSFSVASPLVTDTSAHWRLEGENLGLDNGHLAAEFTRWGRYSINLDFSQLPLAEFGQAQTPFIGSGSGVQQLPQSWVGASSTTGLAALSNSLSPVVIERKRKRLSGEFSWQVDTSLSLTAGYRRETKDGTDTMGAIFGSTGGNPRGSLLRRPIDFDTEELRLGLDRSGTLTQYGLSYTRLDFENRESSIRWRNPFNNPQWITGAGFSAGAVGQLALEPDNRSHQVNAYLGQQLGSASRLTLSVSRTQVEQDETLLPYSTVVNTPAALPAVSLDGRVEQIAATLNVTTRLGARTSLRARYRFRERDNETEQALYLRVAGDAASQAELVSDGARINRLYDQQTDEITIDIDHRLGAGTRLSVGYAGREKDLSMVDAEYTTEQQIYGKLHLAPLSWLDGWIKLSRSERKSHGYDSTRPLVAGHNPDWVATLVGEQRFENDPYLRRYSMADRDRSELAAGASFYPAERIGLTLLGRVSANDYPDSPTGLQRSDLRSLSMDLSYTSAGDWTASLYLNEDWFSNRQYGYARSGGGNPTPVFPFASRDPDRNWRISSEDRVRAVGATLTWNPQGRPYDAMLDLSQSRARSETSPFSTGLAWQPYPDVTTGIASVMLEARYAFRNSQALRVRYTYEDYDSKDFALDQVFADTLNNMLLPGIPSPAYSGHGILMLWEISF